MRTISRSCRLWYMKSMLSKTVSIGSPLSWNWSLRVKLISGAVAPTRNDKETNGRLITVFATVDDDWTCLLKFDVDWSAVCNACVMDRWTLAQRPPVRTIRGVARGAKVDDDEDLELRPSPPLAISSHCCNMSFYDTPISSSCLW